jgi:hypothetical protein
MIPIFKYPDKEATHLAGLDEVVNCHPEDYEKKGDGEGHDAHDFEDLHHGD